MKTVIAALGRARFPAFGLGTWNIGDGARGARRGNRHAAPRARPRRDADRHRGDVRRRPLRGAGGRGDRRPARRGVPRQQGAAGERARAKGDRGRLRAQPEAAAAPTASTSICCTGAAACRSPRPSKRSPRCRRPARSATSASATSTWPTCSEWWKVAGRAGRRREPAALQPLAARHRMGPAALAARAARAGDGLFADRAGALLGDAKLAGFAQRHGMTPAQAALAWLLAKDGVIVIPKTGRRERLKENLGALGHAARRGAACGVRPVVPAAAARAGAGNALKPRRCT